MKRHRTPLAALRCPAKGVETIERLLRWPSLRRRLTEFVRIWSAEHHAYWRPEAKGYTADPAKAGVWSLDEAIASVRHCGPDKQIQLHSPF